jgi:hypothetical protein
MFNPDSVLQSCSKISVPVYLFLLVGQVPSWPGIAHYKFVATIGGGVLVAKVQHSSIAKVGPSMSTQFSLNQSTQICPHRKIGIFPSGYHQLVIRARLIGETSYSSLFYFPVV